VPEFKTPFAEYQQVAQATVADDPVELARTAEQHRQAQLEEWGQYVAAERIYSASGALAFLPGHAVPASSVSDAGPVYPSQVALRPKEQRAALTAPDAAAVPAGNASTDEWRAYAVAHGVPTEEAATLGREEIKARVES
jgi:hypothetical protein